jgi:hypothetical protein
MSLFLGLNRPFSLSHRNSSGEEDMPPSWASFVDNTQAAPVPTTFGTSVTASANHTKGTTVSLLSALAFDVEYVIVTFDDFDVSAGAGDCLADIMYDPAGGTAWQVLIPNLLIGRSGGVSWANSGQTPNRRFEFPLTIPSGATIGVRAQTAHTSDITSGEVVIQCLGDNANANTWTISEIEAIGVSAATSRGTSVTPGSDDAWGSWTNIGSTLGSPCSFLQYSSHGPDGTATTTQGYFAEIGVGNVAIGPKFLIGAGFAETANTFMQMPLYRTFAAGTQFQARAMADGTAQDIDIGIWGGR